MNADAPSPRYIPHNRVAGYRLATLGISHHQTVDPLDPDAFWRSAHPVDQPVQWSLLRSFRSAVGLRVKLLQHLRNVDVALTDRSDEVIQVGQVQGLGYLEQIGVFRLGQPAALDLPIENLAAQLDRGCMLLDAEALTDLVPCAAGPNMSEPVAAGFRRRRGDDLDRLGILELARQAGDASVDARALAMQTNFSVNGEGKVDRRRAFGQLDYVAGGREYENLILIQIELQEFEELVGSFGVELQLEDLSEPLQSAIELVGAARLLL